MLPHRKFAQMTRSEVWGQIVKRGIYTVAVMTIVVIGLAAIGWQYSHRDISVKFPATTDTVINARLKKAGGNRFSYLHYMQNYAAFNDYLNYGTAAPCKEKEGRLTFDKNGVALQWNTFSEVYAFSPVMAAQCGLRAIGAGDMEMAKAQIEGLLASQNDQGGFADAEPYNYYLTDHITAGGVSGMSQGQALSLFARAYHQTGDQRLLEAGKRAVALMGTPVKDGGVMATMSDIDPSLSNYIMFEEVPVTPASHILNGFMFALLGLYDWSQVETEADYNQSQAKDLFDRGIQTLTHALPYYDTGRLSTYDLAYITYKTPQPNISASYHFVHVYLLNALYSITHVAILDRYRAKWQDFGEEAARKFTETIPN